MIIDSGESVGENAIAVFEAFLEIRLPKEYRNHLLKYNGGRLKPSSFSFQNGAENSLVHNVYKLNSRNSYDNVIKRLEVFSGRIHSDYLAIACDPFGNQICLAVKGKNYGRVYFWDHEFESDDGEPPSMDNMDLIADNFDKFLEGLFPYEKEL